MQLPPASRRVALLCVLAGLLVAASPAHADPVLDLERLDGRTAVEMMEDGELTSVQLTRAYITRIAALNKRGPGLNAVTQLNKQALKDAALLDKERADGHVRGPAHGLPILLKDLIDVKGMYTSAGNFSLRNSYPAEDSGVAKKLRAGGVVILGKVGLSEFANYFGGQPSGFSNLTGQVLNVQDADQSPGGSSSASGPAAAAGLSTLNIGTSTGGSISSPASAQSLVGLTPTIGLVPGYGIAPIAASQDTAGPMERTVADAALNLSVIAGFDPLNDYSGLWGPGVDDDFVVPPLPEEVPDYLSALDLDFVDGKRIGYNNTLPHTMEAVAALEARGAIMVERPTIVAGTVPPSVFAYEAKRDINRYYARLGPDAPINSLTEEVEANNASSHEALKFGNNNHAGAEAIDISPSSAASVLYRADLVNGKRISREGIDRMLANDTPDPSDDFIAIIGTPPNPTRAGYPWLTIPMGYSETHRRALSVMIVATAYKERDLIGVGYVMEQGTKKRKPVTQVNPSMYRCAKTVPAPPFAERGGCNPDYGKAMSLSGSAPTLPFSLETESAKSLQERMTAGTLSAETLTKAYLARIALTNAEGPAIQAVRDLNANAVNDAKALDAERASSGVRGPLHGIPVLLDDVIDARGLATTGGSIALQNSTPTADSKLVANLKAAGAIILGKTNVSELGGLFDSNMPEGYSSLGGQVLLPSDTDKTPAGSSAGSAAAAAAGLAAMTVGLETSTDTAQMIAPAGVAGVVALKPTVGRVSRTGVLGVAKSQDSPGPIARTVYDAATQLQAIAGSDTEDPATARAPAAPNYLAGLTPTALNGKRVAVTSSTTAPYPDVLTALTAAGATTVVKTIGTPSPNPPSIVTSEFRRDLNAYLAGKPGVNSLAGIIGYNAANPVEGLKYQQGQLVAAQAVDLSDPATSAMYEADRAAGQASAKALIDGLLSDTDVIVVPSGDALVGIADRAGYPVLTVPAGYGTGGAGRNPIGVTFVGGAFSEDKLLAAGYAFEQATNVRLAPSFTNPSMFRCVTGSTFFSPHHCHPGDLQSETAFGPTETPVAADVGGTVPATLSLSLGLPATFSPFTPGVTNTYTATTTAKVISTAGNAQLSVADPSSNHTGRLVNGTYFLPQPLQARARNAANPDIPYNNVGSSASPLNLLSWSGPTSNDEVTLGFSQLINANDALRTGTYRKTLTYTLSTTAP